MASKGFKRFLKDLEEETLSSDIATVDNKLDMVRRPLKLQKHLQKGKRCKLHKKLNCQECSDNKVIEKITP